MAYKIEEKLVIGVASSALFQLDEADSIFRKEGLNAYRDYQYEHQHDILNTGVAFPFVKRLLAMNSSSPIPSRSKSSSSVTTTRTPGCAYSIPFSTTGSISSARRSRQAIPRSNTFRLTTFHCSFPPIRAMSGRR